jgi:hypothetical protein
MAKKILTLKNCQDPLKIKLPALVRVTRYSSKMLDSDNIYAALKAVRDCIADILRPGLNAGVADDDETLIKFEYYQDIGARNLKIEFYEL